MWIHLNFIYSILWNVVTVYFAAIELFTVLTSVSRYVTLALRYESRPSMYISRPDSTELAEAVLIDPGHINLFRRQDGLTWS